MPLETTIPTLETAIALPTEQLIAFCKRHKIRELSLFGSILRDGFGPHSDIDFLADFDPNTDPSLSHTLQMEDELEALVGRTVDLVDRKDIENSSNPIRRHEILSTARIFYPLDRRTNTPPAPPMPSTQRDLAYLLDILEAAQNIQDYNTHPSFEQFRADGKTQSAIIYQIMVIGEVAKRLSDGCQQDYPNIPWSSIVKMRDRLIHHYSKTKLEKVWEVMTLDIPDLIQALEPLRPQ